MTKEQAVQMGWTMLKVFLSAVVGELTAQGLHIFELSGGQWKTLIGAGVTAVLVTAINWINPNDSRYGVGATKDPQ